MSVIAFRACGQLDMMVFCYASLRLNSRTAMRTRGVGSGETANGFAGQDTLRVSEA